MQCQADGCLLTSMKPVLSGSHCPDNLLDLTVSPPPDIVTAVTVIFTNNLLDVMCDSTVTNVHARSQGEQWVPLPPPKSEKLHQTFSG